MKDYFCKVRIVLLLFLVFILSLGYGQNAKSKYKMKFIEDKKTKKIDIVLGGNHLTTFHFNDSLSKPYFSCLLAKNGSNITKNNSNESNSGVWFAYGDVNGVDFWNSPLLYSNSETNSYGKIVVKSVKTDDITHEMIMEAKWLDKKGKILLEEETRFLFFWNDSLQTIDRITKLTAKKESIELKDCINGLLGLQLADCFTKTNTENIINPRTTEGFRGDSVFGVRSRWCTNSAIIEKLPVSIAIIDNPSNPGYPTFWNTTNYGLFAANPLGHAIFSKGKQELNIKIAEDKFLIFKYRIIIKSGGFLTDNELNSEFNYFKISTR